MHTFLGILRTIILFGAIQGFIIASMLFFSKKNRKSNRLLACLIFLLSLACLNLYGQYTGWFGSNFLSFVTQLIPMVVIMPIGPLILFYIKSSLDPSFHLRPRERWQFLPVMIDLVPSLAAIVFVIGVITHSLANRPGPWGQFIDTYNVYADIPRWLSVTTYLVLSSRHLSTFHSQYHGRLNGYTANFQWIRQFVRVFLVFQTLWLLFLVPYVIPKYTDKLLDAVDWYPLYIPLAIIIYWLGIRGYAISQQGAPRTMPTHARLTPQLIEDTMNALTAAMKCDKLYLNPGCDLALVAQKTGIPQKVISAVLNQHIHKSFNEFVNEFRIETFKQRILQADLEKFTLAAIAMDCGFNSQATFQRTFKQTTGMSPSEYRLTSLQSP